MAFDKKNRMPEKLTESQAKSLISSFCLQLQSGFGIFDILCSKKMFIYMWTIYNLWWLDTLV